MILMALICGEEMSEFGWPKRIVFCRHGESESNVLSARDPRAFAKASPFFLLTERGKEQAQIAGEYLKRRFGKFDSYFTSYYVRAKETMKIMFPEAKVIEDARLAESQWGLWQTMPEEDVKAKYPDEFQRKNKDGIGHYRAFGGESWLDIQIRIHSFLTTLRMDYINEHILIVCHGNWHLFFDCLMKYLTMEESIERYKAHEVMKNCEIGIYEPRSIGSKSQLTLIESGIVPWKGLV